jgi:RNA polymerase sigma factor (sigma-70 family)
MTTALSTGLRRVAARLAPDPAPDGELLIRFLSSRDEGAFAVLVRRHAGMVFGTCRRVLGNAADADDAFQAAFVMLARKAHTLTDRTCVGNFLYGIAFHTALKARAMATKRKAKEAQVATASRERERPESDELSRALDEELAKLPEKYREPVVLCELEGVSRKDAATRLGIPEGTISSRLATAHRMLEKRLKARGFAAVGIMAVLGGQAFAVTDTLTDAAVRAATSAAPAGVTHLATEVTKMFLLTKLKLGTAVLASVALLLGVGVGLAQRGAAKERENLRAPVPKKDEPKTDRERILGTWVMSEIKQVGVTPTDEQKKRWAAGGFNITFTADEMIYEVDQSRVKYRLDPVKDPKVIEILEGDTVVALGLYELMGDDLKVCIGRKPEQGMPPVAPTALDPDQAPAGTFSTAYVMKRDKPKAKKPDDAKKLLGKWVTKAVTYDPPFPVGPGETHTPAHHELTFTDKELTWVTFIPNDPATRHEQTKPYKLDQAASPRELTSGVNECVYEMDGDTLKLAMYFLTPGRPKGFTAKDSPPGRGHVVLVELTREKDDPKKEQAKKSDDAAKLLGKWVRKSQTIDPPPKLGAAPGVVVLPTAEWTFKTTGLTVESTALEKTHVSELLYTLDPATTPKQLTLVNKGGKTPCIYELDGDTLRVAMYGIPEKGRPRGFKATADDPTDAGPLMVEVYERVKEDNSYSLKAGEMLKLIPAPFPVERGEVFKLAGDRHPFQSADDCLMAVTVDKDKGQPASAHAFTNRHTPGADAPGKSLASFLEHGLRIDMTKLVDPAGLLASTVLDADVVLKKGAAPTDLIAALRKELKAKCGVDLVLEFREAETEVVIISGEHTLNPTPTETSDPRVIDGASVIHLYATAKQEHANTLIANTTAFPRELAKFLGRPVIDQSDLGKNVVLVKTTFHERSAATEKVLQNLANQTGLVFKLGKQKVRALVVAKADEPKAKPPEKKEEAKKADEPAWKAEFRKAYGLADGQLVRRVAPPYPACREEYLKDLYKGGAGSIPSADWFAILGWKGDWTDSQAGQFTMPIKPDVGVPLESLLDRVVKFPPIRIESDRTTMERKVTGDFVVRTGADPEKVVKELEAVLRKELELPVKFSFKDEEEEVYVLGGKYAAKPLDGTKDGRIEVYAQFRNDGKTGGGGSGTLKELAAALERHVVKVIVLDEVEGEPKSVEWHFNDRDRPFTRQEWEEDRNAPRVLANIADQTGLTVTTAKRKVRKLAAEHVEVKR